MPSMTLQGIDREGLARWYASRHFAIDPGVLHIFHLPTNAPANEIRFLEVNTMIAEMIDPEPVDFGVDVGPGERHRLVVLDVTPCQWEAIQTGRFALPSGWTLDGSRELYATVETDE